LLRSRAVHQQSGNWVIIGTQLWVFWGPQILI